jgi:hypothetical protein
MVLTQMLTATNPVQNVAAAPAGLNDAESALRAKDQQANMKAHKVAEVQGAQVEQAGPSAGPAGAQPQDTAARSSEDSGKTAPVTEGKLLDYLGKAGTGGGSLEPSAFMKSGVESFVGIVENAQNALTKKVASSEGQVQQASTDAAATDKADGKSGAAPTQANMDDMLDRYVSISWATFSASLATNSVSAASSSVNTLVKQQ